MDEYKRNYNRSDADYNRRQIEKRIDWLCAVARGTDASFRPLICDASGKYSDRKAMKFINDIVVRAGGYKGKQAEFFKAFLYCCIRCPAEPAIMDRLMEYYNPLRICSSFQDILDKAKQADADGKQTWLKDMNELMFYEYSTFDSGDWELEIENEEQASFFISMDEYCAWLNRWMDEEDGSLECMNIDPDGFDEFFEEISGTGVDRDTMDAGWREQRYEMHREAENIEEERDIEEEACYLQEDIDSEVVNGQDPLGFPEGYDPTFWPNKEEWEKYRDEFVGIDKFTEMYKKYRKLFFEVPHDGMYKRIEEMIFWYMYDNGMSVCVSDEAVVDEFRSMEIAAARLGSSIKRSRIKNGIKFQR